MIKTAAVDGPDFAANALVTVRRVGRRFEVIVQPDEIKRRTNPGDAGDEMQPARKQIEPVDEVGFH